jgi:hypothetical protein
MSFAVMITGAAEALAGQNCAGHGEHIGNLHSTRGNVAACWQIIAEAWTAIARAAACADAPASG